MRKVLLDYQGIIKGPSISEKTSLTRSSDILKIGLDYVNNDLNDKLVGGVTKPYRSEVFQISGVFRFGNKKIPIETYCFSPRMSQKFW